MAFKMEAKPRPVAAKTAHRHPSAAISDWKNSRFSLDAPNESGVTQTLTRPQEGFESTSVRLSPDVAPPCVQRENGSQCPTIQAAIGTSFPGAAVLDFKLEVGPINDPMEAEADRVADRVMRLPATLAPSDARRGSTGIEVHRKAEASAGPKGGALSASVASHLHQLPTRPMPGQLRDFFEPRFGRSFDDVHLSTGPQAESLAARLGARAFSVGDTIGFARGAFTPSTFAGRWLLAHELVHVNQHADQSTSSIVRRSPPIEDQMSTPQAIASELLSTSRLEAELLINEIDGIDRLRKVRDELSAHPKSFVRDQAHMTFLLATLDERAVELISIEEFARHEERQLMDLFVTTVQSMLKGKGAQLQPSEMEYLGQLLDGMSTQTLKHLEKKLVLWPKAGVSIRMKKILDLVTARTRQSDVVESQRGRYGDDVGEEIQQHLRLQTKEPKFAGNQCLKFLDTVGVEALFTGQSAQLGAADKEYRKLSNRNKEGLHRDATLSRLASELRIQDLVGPINILPWNANHERYDPPPHELFDRLSSAGSGWYFFLASVASFHTIMVAVHVTGSTRTYFEIDNHNVVSKDAAEIDEAFDSFGSFQKVPSRVWQVYVQPAT